MRYLQKQNITMATKEGKSLLWALASAHSCQVIARQTQSGSLHTQHIMLLAAAKALRCATSSSQSAHTSPRGSGSDDWKRTVSLIPCLAREGVGMLLALLHKNIRCSSSGTNFLGKGSEEQQLLTAPSPQCLPGAHSPQPRHSLPS